MRVIYFDENATASPSRKANQLAAEWLMGPPANASSIHTQGRRARGAIELSRRQVASSLGVSPRHLTFTSGATEALHTVIMGVLSAGDHVLVSAVEHPAVWGALELVGAKVDVVPVDLWGRVSPADFSRKLTPHTRLAIMMAAQNEIGTIYPLKEVAERLGDVPLLVDAVQAYGKVQLKLEETGATYAVISGHKIGAPQGVGIIWGKDGAPFNPLIRGGSQERGRRAGTENVAAIVGIGAAASEIQERLDQMIEVRSLREILRAHLAMRGEKYAKVIGHFEDLSLESDLSPNWRQHGQLPNTLNLITPHIEGDLLLQQLDLMGFCLSTGSACASGALEPSPVLRALGFSSSESSRGLRVSMGVRSTRSDLEALIAGLDELLHH